MWLGVGLSSELSLGLGVGLDLGLDVGLSLGLGVGLDVGLGVGLSLGLGCGADFGAGCGAGSWWVWGWQVAGYRASWGWVWGKVRGWGSSCGAVFARAEGYKWLWYRLSPIALRGHVRTN